MDDSRGALEDSIHNSEEDFYAGSSMRKGQPSATHDYYDLVSKANNQSRKNLNEGDSIAHDSSMNRTAAFEP